MVICIIVFAIILLILLSIFIYKESNGYRIVNYSFSDGRLKTDSLKIVFLSDLHNRQYGENNSTLLNDIDKINPDIVIIGGDMITSCAEKWKGCDVAVSLVQNLTGKYPVFYGVGNHEARLKRKAKKFPVGEYERFTKVLSELSAPILTDESVELIEYGVKIFSVDIEHRYYRKVITRKLPDDYLSTKIGSPDSDMINILLAHNPEHFKSYAEWGADIVLSGHVHGGVVRIPFVGGVISPAFKIFPKYDGGEFKEGNSTMFLSRGIGTHSIPIRINNKAEVVVINIDNNR